MKKNIRFIECLMLFVCLTLGGCSEGEEAIGTLSKPKNDYSGYWIVGKYGTDSNKGQDDSDMASGVYVTPNRVIFRKMPCSFFVEQVVPASLQKEARYNVLASDYALKMTQVGQSAENIYLQLERKDYSFKTTYGGEQHEIRLVMGDDGSAVGSPDYSRMSFVLSVERILLDGDEVVSYADEPLKLTFVYPL